MQGRFHFYEGYSMKEVTFPVRVMYELGIKTLFVSNAAGGMNPKFRIGDLMIITDHINFFPEHPLRGKNYPTGPRFPDMHETYDKKLIKLASDIAYEKKIRVTYGVYIGLQGPTFETPAEYRMYHLLGADAVGMSTVPEVIVAHHCGIRTFGISVITDLGGFDNPVEVSHEEVQEAAVAEPADDTPDADAIMELCRRAHLVNLSPKEGGTIKFKGVWEMIDQMLASPAAAGKIGSAEVFRPGFLLEEDKTFLGCKPRRTNVGPRYNGGASDHLPLLVRVFCCPLCRNTAKFF